MRLGKPFVLDVMKPPPPGWVDPDTADFYDIESSPNWPSDAEAEASIAARNDRRERLEADHQHRHQRNALRRFDRKLLRRVRDGGSDQG